MKKWNWKNLLPPPMLVALLFASCNLIQEMPQDFVETYGNIAYVEKVDYVGLAEDVENGKPAKVTQTKNFKIIYSIRNDGNFDLSPEFTFEGCQIKNPHVDTEKKRVSLTVPGEELKALADGAEFKVKLTLYKASQKVLQSAYELGMRYVRTDEPETPKFPVEIPIPGLKLPDGYTLSVKDSTEFKAEYDKEKGSWIITTIGSGVSEAKYTLELVVKDKDGNPLKDENGNEITIDKTIEVSAGGTTSGFTEKDDEKSFDEFIKEVEEKIKENETNPPEESKNPPTEPETPKGTVEIKVEVPEGYTIVDIEDKDKFKVEKGEDGSYKIVTKEEGGLPEGEYELELVVKDEKTGEEVTIKKEVEVSAGETTGGFTGEPDDKPSEITQDEIEKEKKNVVYVRGSDASWYENNYPDATASDTNSGALLEPFETIQKAVDKIIAMNDGESPYTICIDGTLKQSAAPSDNKKGMADFSALDKDLKLTIRALPGTDPNETQKATLNAGGNSRVMYAKPTSGKLELTLKNLVITGGNASSANGGGIYFDGSDSKFKMEGCTVKGSEATNGGGIYLNSGTLELNDCTVGGENESDKNDAATGAGIYVADGTNKFEMTGGEISKNNATSVGGGIYITGSKEATISGTKIYDNKARVDGGGIYVIGGALTMDGTITNNTAQQGGGVYVRDNNGVFTMTGGEISGNHTTTETTSDNDKISGGGIFIHNGAKADISDTTISNNTSNHNGGGIHINGGTLKIKAGTIISGNVAENYGGGVYVNDIFDMDGGTISGNTAKQDGGGVYVTGNNGVFTMSNGTINGGNTAQFGGGVYIGDNGKFIMNYGEISGNKADKHADSGGGGVNVNSGEFEMKGGTISGNEATGSNFGGGGVYVHTGQTFTMSGTAKISGNKATKGKGGGVYSEGGTFTMNSGTIGGDTTDDKNTAYYGGGVYVKSGTFKMNGGEISGNEAIESTKASSGRGAGVYVDGANFEMSGTAKICRNKGANDGSGVCVTGGTSKFTMNNGSICNNETSSSYGGGVYIAKNNEFEMNNDSTISENFAPDGGGVYVAGLFTMNDGTISNNGTSSNNNVCNRGGGVCVYGEFIMNKGKIIDNTAKTQGGGIYLTYDGIVNSAGGKFTMNGGTFSGNKTTETNESKGAYIETTKSTFNMSGDAKFDENNDVYFFNENKINIVGALAASTTPVATITPSSYVDERQVLSVNTGVTMDEVLCNKLFSITPQDNGTNTKTKWKISYDSSSRKGVLKKDNVDVGGGGGISVTVPNVGTYIFEVKYNGAQINDGDKLPSNSDISIDVKDSNGNSVNGTFKSEIQDRSGIKIAEGVKSLHTPSYPFELDAQIYVKVELTSGIVIDKTIFVKIKP